MSNQKIKTLRVTMPDGSRWDVPAEIIAINRAKSYEEDEPGSYEDIYAETIESAYEVRDWAAGNMNWDDVKSQAVKFADAETMNFQDGWVNGEQECVLENV
jgi:hypothetical protein